jgi:ribosomal-protein-alanine N-acetyltransferase
MLSLLQFTDDIALTEYEDIDKAALIRWLNDPLIAQNTLTIPNPYTPADADWWIQNIREQKDKSGRCNNWAIRHKTEGLIGGIGIFFHSGPDGHFDELGYWIAAPYRGRGLMSLIVKKFSRWQFEIRPKLLRLEGWVFTHNLASMKVLEKAGYQREGLSPKRFFKNGQAMDAVLFGQVR